MFKAVHAIMAFLLSFLHQFFKHVFHFTTLSRLWDTLPSAFNNSKNPVSADFVKKLKYHIQKKLKVAYS